MLPTFVIGLREGLEASLIVGIIAAFMIHRGERRGLRPMWIGVVAAVILCLGIAIALRAIDESLPHRQQEGLATLLALAAVTGVTYMIVWMRRHARELKSTLEASAESALATGSSRALVGMAFFAVLREGLETSVFVLAAFQSSQEPQATGVGAALGILVAVGLGYGIYRGGIRVNLTKFFRVTGFVLVLVAAGLLAAAAHTAAEAGWLSVMQQSAFDLTWLVKPGSVRSALLTGMLGVQPVPSVAEVVLWVLYAVTMGLYVLWPHSPRPRARTAVVPVSQ